MVLRVKQVELSKPEITSYIHALITKLNYFLTNIKKEKHKFEEASMN